MPHAHALDQLKYDADGLVPIIVQDVENGQVLMMAYANRTALERTLATGLVHTYSRSRGRLALKGESSRHFQHVRSVMTDCDRDVVLVKVVQDVAACHEGYRSCFFRELDGLAVDGATVDGVAADGATVDGQWRTTAARQFDPDEVYSK